PDGEPLTEFKMPVDTSSIVEKKYPVLLGDELMGHVLLGVSQAAVQRGITESNARIGDAIDEVSQSGDKTLSSFTVVTAFQVIAVLLVVSAIIFFMFRSAVINPTKETIDLIKQLSRGNGDLTVHLPIQNNDEISMLRQAVNEFIEQLRSMITTVTSEVETLSREAADVRHHGEILSGTADSLQLQSTQAATAMNEMVANVQEVARNTTVAAGAANDADGHAKDGKNVVMQTTDSINQLAEQVEFTAEAIQALAKDSSSIGQVLDVIKGVAEQTNLLALNAAIEAARAGEQGRGFAVVADEVRTLASRTQHSTLEIQEMIERLQTGAQNAVSAMERGQELASEGVRQVSQADDALGVISKSVSSIDDMNAQIATASEEQAAVAEEINRNIDSIKQSSEQAADSAKVSDQSSKTLANVAMRLEQLVGQFRV
ncbi:MAG: methyl-accepting chemotaxis protein, partial [Gammaproteobacteria bacterium]